MAMDMLQRITKTIRALEEIAAEDSIFADDGTKYAHMNSLAEIRLLGRKVCRRAREEAGSLRKYLGSQL